MNKSISMKYPVVLLSAFAMGTSMAAANETKCDCPCDDNRASVSAEKDQGQYGATSAENDQDRGVILAETDQDQYGASNNENDQDRYGAADADKDQDRYGAADTDKDQDRYGVASAEKDQDRYDATGAENDTKELGSTHASTTDKDRVAADVANSNPQYLTSKPADDYFSESIIGQDIINRRDNEVVGTVDELLIDKDGQIAAVIISTGGVLGVGEKDLAIAWDQIEREVDGDETTLSVDLSDDSISEAPSFARQ